jgi:uncharacterized protein
VRRPAGRGWVASAGGVYWRHRTNEARKAVGCMSDAVDGIVYWDCNVMVGMPPSGARTACPDADALLREMDWVGVQGALVYHAVTEHGAPIQGNPLTSQMASVSPRLYATWALLPPATRELPAGDALFLALRGHDVRALWAFPRQHRYHPNRVTFGSLLDKVAERRIPVLMPCSDGWAPIAELLADYPELVLVAVGNGPWGDDRYFRPLMDVYEHLHLDISRYELSGGLAELVRYYGTDRLLYGSGYPRWSMGGPRLMLARAEIDDEARRRIAGGNLKRLLEEAEL